MNLVKRLIRQLKAWVRSVRQRHLRTRVLEHTPVVQVPIAILESPEGIVFSKDRPMQLDALLRSYRECVKNPAPLHLIYSASSERYQAAYASLIETHRSHLASIRNDSTGFKKTLVEVFSTIRTPAVFFLVDDILFKNALDWSQFRAYPLNEYVPSLRLGAHLSRCYTLNCTQSLPRFYREEPLLEWNWKSGDCDWGYPLSVDGHVFMTHEVKPMIDHLSYKAPNSFEGALQVMNSVFRKRRGVAFRESVIINIPCNKVQTENDNLHGSLHQDRMLERWERGERINVNRFRGLRNQSAHEDVAIDFISEYISS